MHGGSRGAFSLIELLVVLAIVALLAGLLLPALARARDAGRVAACLGNVQQLGVATHAYAADSRDRLPRGPVDPAHLAANLTTWDRFFCNFVWTGSDPELAPLGGSYLGHGRLLQHHYLTETTAIFCPGADQPVDYQAELAKIGHVGGVGTADAFSGYAYRSLDQTTKDHVDDLGVNAAGLPARTLFADVNRYGPQGLPDISPVATNHRARVANLGYLDGHAATRDNAGSPFTALPEHYAGFPADPTGPLKRFAQILVTADYAESGDARDAPTLP